MDRGGYYSGENGDNIAAYNDDNSDIWKILIIIAKLSATGRQGCDLWRTQVIASLPFSLHMSIKCEKILPALGR